MDIINQAVTIGTDVVAVGGAVVLLSAALYALVQAINSKLHNPVLTQVAADLAEVKAVVSAFDAKLAQGLAELPQPQPPANPTNA